MEYRTIKFNEPNCCIRCGKELAYWTMTPTACEDCWSDVISERLIQNVKKQMKIKDKTLIVIFLLTLPFLAFGQRSPYQRKIASAASMECREADNPFLTNRLLSVAEVNTNGGRNDFAKINNPFKIVCYSKTCKVGHCENVDPNKHKVFYRKFNSVGESCEAYMQKYNK